MAISLVVNGVTYDYPETGDVEWGPDATDWAQAVTSGMLQKAGGLFQLLAEVDFGTNYGVKALSYKTRTSNVADAGQFRLARADVINWRNQANDGNLSLGVSASNVLQFNGVNIQNSLSVSDTSTIDLTFSSDTLSAAIIAGSITNALISASAAIDYSKLALTGSIVNADLANMSQATIKGRASGAGTGAPTDLTATQATAILNNFVGDSGSGGTKGLVPAPAAGDAAALKFLKADGTWTTPPGSGDVVGPASSTDNGFARFDGLTGKLLKDSAATLVNADISASAAIAYSKLASLTASRALVSDGSGFISAATTTAAEIGYVNGVTSAIQTQLNGKLPTTITTTGDLIYSSSGTTASRLAIGSPGQVLGAAGGVPAWVINPGASAIRSVTTTDSPDAVTDTTLVCSSSSFTITLPTPASGKIYRIIHNGTSISQVYTLATTAGATIGGVASGAYALYTNGESLEIQFDGTNFIILDHKTTTGWVSWTPTSSWNTNVTLTGRKSRVADRMLYTANIALSGAPNNTSLTINMPSGEVIDTAKFAVTPTAQSTILSFNNTAVDSSDGNRNYSVALCYSTTTAVRMRITRTFNGNLYIVSDNDFSSTLPFAWGTGDFLTAFWDVPIVGFQP